MDFSHLYSTVMEKKPKMTDTYTLMGVTLGGV
jgi:hypothetical protein